MQPWFENVAKRQVKAPKVYLRDAGLLHALLDIRDEPALLAHPRVGASWEGFVVEQVLHAVQPSNAWFWATHGGGELDLLVFDKGRRIGFEVKFNEAPDVTRSMREVVRVLSLEHLFVVCPGRDAYPVDSRISVVPIRDVPSLRQRLDAL